MVTLSEFRARCRLILSGEDQWSSNTIDVWIGDAIRAYSLEFPRSLRTTLNMTTGVQAYELLGDILAVVSVQYPAGAYPLEYCWLVGDSSKLFASGGPFYALRGVADDEPGNADYVNTVIVFAAAVSDGEQAIVSYRGLHRIPAAGADDDYITVPDAHLEALAAFVEFRSMWDLQTRQAYAEDDVTVILAQLGENARRAWNRYKELTGRYQGITPVPSGRVSWGNIGL
jgi:hypothetical protein